MQKIIRLEAKIEIQKLSNEKQDSEIKEHKLTIKNFGG